MRMATGRFAAFAVWPIADMSRWPTSAIHEV